MDVNVNALEVVNNSRDSRFEIALNGEIAVIEYMLHGKNLTFTHTEVPVAFEGKGIAGKMAKFALDYARDHEMKVNPLCPYINQYIERHPEYKVLTWGN